MQIVSGRPAELSPQDMAAVAGFRLRTLIEKLGGQFRCETAYEHDRFDRDDTVYVAARDRTGRLVGSARLLPTTRPYALSEVFADLLNGQPAPASPEVWELSRFAAVDFSVLGLAHTASPIALQLLRASLHCAAAHGAKCCITASLPGLERLVKMAGFTAHRLTPPTLVKGNPVSVYSIHCDTVHRQRPPVTWSERLEVHYATPD